MKGDKATKNCPWSFPDLIGCFEGDLAGLSSDVDSVGEQSDSGGWDCGDGGEHSGAGWWRCCDERERGC